MGRRVLGVIPARGGSKGIPRKNMHPILQKPMIEYSISAALGSQKLTDCVVSTEDEEIAEVSRILGAQVPFMRPAELSEDDALSIDVVRHATSEMESIKGEPYEVVVMLQPTSPLRTSEDIDTGIEMLLRSAADSVISVVLVDQHPFRMKRVLPDGRLAQYIDLGFEDMRPRQLLPDVYVTNGALYVVRRDVLVKEGTFIGKESHAYVMPPERSANVDSHNDLVLAEYWLSRRTGQ